MTKWVALFRGPMGELQKVVVEADTLQVDERTFVLHGPEYEYDAGPGFHPPGTMLKSRPVVAAFHRSDCIGVVSAEADQDPNLKDALEAKEGDDS